MIICDHCLKKNYPSKDPAEERIIRTCEVCSLVRNCGALDLPQVPFSSPDRLRFWRPSAPTAPRQGQ
jgi:hypothetical protein